MFYSCSYKLFVGTLSNQPVICSRQAKFEGILISVQTVTCITNKLLFSPSLRNDWGGKGALQFELNWLFEFQTRNVTQMTKTVGNKNQACQVEKVEKKHPKLLDLCSLDSKIRTRFDYSFSKHFEIAGNPSSRKCAQSPWKNVWVTSRNVFLQNMCRTG